ncbi:hypothetical protein RF11_12224 [Thelohanellus kitauei]|uniref:Uncharacterized protein n=1 Tax=Thelohanellus kitauei TaxID=669202 RepID=A0A0C2IC08_THEKT|nr:hypothetical protein RF11_12224 [Thelohanellus kitauei]
MSLITEIYFASKKEGLPKDSIIANFLDPNCKDNFIPVQGMLKSSKRYISYICNPNDPPITELIIQHKKTFIQPGMMPINFTCDTGEKILKKYRVYVRRRTSTKNELGLSDILIFNVTYRENVPSGFQIIPLCFGQMLIAVKYIPIPQTKVEVTEVRDLPFVDKGNGSLIAEFIKYSRFSISPKFKPFMSACSFSKIEKFDLNFHQTDIYNFSLEMIVLEQK